MNNQNNPFATSVSQVPNAAIARGVSNNSYMDPFAIPISTANNSSGTNQEQNRNQNNLFLQQQYQPQSSVDGFSPAFPQSQPQVPAAGVLSNTTTTDTTTNNHNIYSDSSFDIFNSQSSSVGPSAAPVVSSTANEYINNTAGVVRPQQQQQQASAFEPIIQPVQQHQVQMQDPFCTADPFGPLPAPPAPTAFDPFESSDPFSGSTVSVTATAAATAAKSTLVSPSSFSNGSNNTNSNNNSSNNSSSKSIPATKLSSFGSNGKGSFSSHASSNRGDSSNSAAMESMLKMYGVTSPPTRTSPAGLRRFGSGNSGNDSSDNECSETAAAAANASTNSHNHNNNSFRFGSNNKLGGAGTPLEGRMRSNTAGSCRSEGSSRSIATCEKVREGSIYARYDTLSMLPTGRWQEIYWAVDENHLFLYKDKKQFSHYYSPFSPEGSLKMIPLTTSTRPVLPLKTKQYHGQGVGDVGAALTTFMLVDAGEYGQFNVAKFAHNDYKSCEYLALCILEVVRAKRHMCGH